MPRGDGTGPGGMGPMTGRAAGYCAGYHVPGYLNTVPGRGYVRGGGWGYRNRFYTTGLYKWQRTPYAYPAATGYLMPYYGPPAYPTRQQELEGLQGRAKYLADELEGINKRMRELETESVEPAK